MQKNVEGNASRYRSISPFSVIYWQLMSGPCQFRPQIETRQFIVLSSETRYIKEHITLAPHTLSATLQAGQIFKYV